MGYSRFTDLLTYLMIAVQVTILAAVGVYILMALFIWIF